MCSVEGALAMGGGKDDILSVWPQRQPHISRSAVDMEITPEISSRTLRTWQCALVKWKDPLAWGRRNSACNTVYTGEKTYVEWRCKGIVSDVVQMWECSVRDNFSLPNRWPAEPIPVFRAMLSMPSHMLWFDLCASMDWKHSQHLIFSLLCPSLPPSPKGKEAERRQSMLLIPTAWERICGWLLCEKCNEEMSTCTFPRTKWVFGELFRSF